MTEPARVAREDPVREFLSEQVRAGRFPGAAWWVGSAAAVASSGSVGWASLEPSRSPVSDATPFDLASLTKPLVTAWLLTGLEREGALDLCAPAAHVLPELCSGPYAAVTLVDLGAHRSGLPAWRPIYLGATSIDAYVRAIAAIEPAATRGETLYSDLGFILLGAVLERVAGVPLDTLFRRRIAVPLGLERAGFAREGTSAFPDAAATERGNAHEETLAGPDGARHRWRTRVLRGEVHDGNAHGLGGVAGHAGLFGTAAEVARLALEILRPEVLAWSGHRRELLLAPVAGPGSRTFGWVPAAESGAGRGVLPDDAPGHTGFTGTSVWLEPRSGGVFVLLTNRVHPAVPPWDFQEVRREFHRQAWSLFRGGTPPSAPPARSS